VFQGWVIVLVGVSSRHVFPLAAVPEVVHDVRVLVGMNDRVMGVPWLSPLYPVLTLQMGLRSGRQEVEDRPRVARGVVLRACQAGRLP
jgi:hypothetical protein